MGGCSGACVRACVRACMCMCVCSACVCACLLSLVPYFSVCLPLFSGFVVVLFLRGFKMVYFSLLLLFLPFGSS